RNGIYLQSSYNDVFIYNNLIYSDAGHDYGIYIRSPETMPNMSVTIKNNIFYTTSGNIGDFPLFWDGTKDINEAPAVSHNLYYNPDNTNRIKWFRWPDTITYDSTEQTAWRDAGHPGALFANPLFVHQSTGNFALQSTSPAIDKGTNLGSPYNLGLNPNSTWPNNVSTLDQNNCGIGWEIGAYVFTGIAQSPIDQTGWSLLWVDSEETSPEAGEDGAAVNSFDGDPDTIWHTEWPENPPHPHEIQIDLGGFYDICGFRYLPRQDDNENGMIKDYEFYVSNNTSDWGTAVASGTWTAGKVEKQVSFDCTLGQYVRLVALLEVNGNPWTTMAELNVLAVQPDTDINNDGRVNIEDFAIMAAWWDDDGGCVEPGWCGGADFSMSGTVDFTDLAYFVENWLRQTW
ncbi:MAG: discoidin domain-containing protein, partial [Sedimentisphaerales bacterium]|nr:discoidin domain-containing protein [Sedimentisphaerales bacterium]